MSSRRPLLTADGAGILDCVQRGKRLSEAGYSSVEDPVSCDARQRLTRQTQKSLFSALGMQPKPK